MAIVMNSEEYRHKKRLEMLERWKANPEKMKVGLAFCHSEAGTKRRVESVRKTFSSKEWKEYKSANMKEVWRRPGFREKIKLASASFFSDPVKKKKRIENLISPKNRMKARMTVYARNFCKLKEKGECSTPLEFSNLLFSLNEAGKSPNAISKMFGIGFKAAKLWIKYRQIVPTTMVV